MFRITDLEESVYFMITVICNVNS